MELENENGQRKMRMKVDGMDMPFMTWSAGQKEFMPLLMGFYCVSGPPMQLLNKDQYDYICDRGARDGTSSQSDHVGAVGNTGVGTDGQKSHRIYSLYRPSRVCVGFQHPKKIG